jgi:predicted acylesterase/phospholipase RssA
MRVWRQCHNWWYGEQGYALVQELRDLDDVVREISEEVYNKAVDLIWDVGEIVVYRRKLQRAEDWKTWSDAANTLDNLTGKDEWKKKDQSEHYDFELLRRRYMTMKQLRLSDDIPALVHHMRSGLVRSLGGSLNPALYTFALTGTKHLIEAYREEVCKTLQHISHSGKFDMDSKMKFFSESRYTFGKTALLLSGGGGLGMYHFGVIKALYDQNLLPRIIAGASAGSIVAALICTTGMDNLYKAFEPGFMKYGPFEGLKKGSIMRKLKRFFKTGVLMDIRILKHFVKENIGELTFMEAYEKTGFILNVTVSEYNQHSDYRLLNYLTAPHVLIWSAVLASCAIPYVFEPVELMCRDHKGQIVPYHTAGLKFIDGSIKADLPMQRLSELFNVNAFIVSQTNPWVIPLLSSDDGGGTWGDSMQFKVYKVFKRLLLMEFRHRVAQLSTVGIASWLTRSLEMFTQEYRGHVTIWPVPSLKDYKNILSNPSDEDIQRCIRESNQRTFPKMNMLKGILTIEKTFDLCYSQLKLGLVKRSLQMTDPAMVSRVDSVALRIGDMELRAHMKE